MPDKSSINLNNILREEMKLKKTKTQGSRLIPLENDFYVKAARQIHELEDEKKKIDDIYSTKYAIIENELKTARKDLENLINLRTAKIITEASLPTSLKQKDKSDVDSMTLEEREFYNQLLELMMKWREWRGTLLSKARARETKVNETKINEMQSIPVSAASPENKKEETSSEGKKDISKEYIVVRLLKDIPTFVGVDGRNYTLAKEDVAVLSAVNAKALINRKAAIQISVKR